MTKHIPLNGDQVTNAVAAALSGSRARPGFAGALSAALRGSEQDDAPDGTNGTTKTATDPGGETLRVSATDPSQGRAPAPKARGGNRDPLMDSLMSLKSMNR